MKPVSQFYRPRKFSIQVPTVRKHLQKNELELERTRAGTDPLERTRAGTDPANIGGCISVEARCNSHEEEVKKHSHRYENRTVCSQ